MKNRCFCVTLALTEIQSLVRRTHLVSGYRIVSKRRHPKGILFKIRAGGKIVEALLTYHALDRTTLWGLSEGQVLESLLYPEEVLTGHYGRYIAHKRPGTHVVRAVYEYEKKTPALITVYCPLATRYFEGEGRYEDKILA